MSPSPGAEPHSWVFPVPFLFPRAAPHSRVRLLLFPPFSYSLSLVPPIPPPHQHPPAHPTHSQADQSNNEDPQVAPPRVPETPQIHRAQDPTSPPYSINSAEVFLSRPTNVCFARKGTAVGSRFVLLVFLLLLVLVARLLSSLFALACRRCVLPFDGEPGAAIVEVDLLVASFARCPY